MSKETATQALHNQLKNHGKEARELLGMLHPEDNLDDIRHRCRVLRMSIINSCRKGGFTPEFVDPSTFSLLAYMDALHKILAFPFPQSASAPHHQLFGWLSHVAYCVETYLADIE